MSRARRVVMFSVTRIVLGALVYTLVVSAFVTVNRVLGLGAREVVRTAEAAAGALFALFVLGRYVERRPPAEWGLPRERRVADTARGFGYGALLLCVSMGLFAVLGWYRVRGWGVLPAGTTHEGTFGLAVLTYLFVSVHEEVLFRGIFFRVIEESGGTYVALLASSLLFGLTHVFNPNATVLSGLAIAVEAGLLLGCAYVLTRSLWFPIGIHWAWNLFEGPLFGTPVSGTQETHLLAGVVHGPALWTGGEFGPEGGLLVTLLGLALGGVFFVRARARGHLR